MSIDSMLEFSPEEDDGEDNGTTVPSRFRPLSSTGDQPEISTESGRAPKTEKDPITGIQDIVDLDDLLIDLESLPEVPLFDEEIDEGVTTGSLVDAAATLPSPEPVYVNIADRRYTTGDAAMDAVEDMDSETKIKDLCARSRNRGNFGKTLENGFRLDVYRDETVKGCVIFEFEQPLKTGIGIVGTRCYFVTSSSDEGKCLSLKHEDHLFVSVAPRKLRRKNRIFSSDDIVNLFYSELIRKGK